MTTPSTGEQLARQILKISIHHFKCRPGFTIQRSSYLPILNDLGMRTDEFNAGMDYATKRGWVDVLENGKLYRITSSGFTQT